MRMLSPFSRSPQISKRESREERHTSVTSKGLLIIADARNNMCDTFGCYSAAWSVHHSRTFVFSGVAGMGVKVVWTLTNFCSGESRTGKNDVGGMHSIMFLAGDDP